VPLIADMDMEYYGYELPTQELFNEEYDAVWDTLFNGRLTLECAQGMLDQFEGLPITDGHIEVMPGRREEVAVGTFLSDATLDGDMVVARALIYAATAIIKIDTEGSELSIGGMAFMRPNDLRGTAGQPDFFIDAIDLNHVALVERGRAGPDARLLNHRASIAHHNEKVPHMKVTINGVEIEVPDVAVNHYTGLLNNLESTVSSLTADKTALANQASTLTTERDTAQGALTAAQSELEIAKNAVVELENAKPDVTVEAARIANEHAAFVVEAEKLGHVETLSLGSYDRTAIMRSVLNARGGQFAEDASVDTLKGGWQFAIANVGTVNRSAVDPQRPAHVQILNVSGTTMDKVNASYFGGGKKKEA
jgi:hypothetical protein